VLAQYERAGIGGSRDMGVAAESETLGVLTSQWEVIQRFWRGRPYGFLTQWTRLSRCGSSTWSGSACATFQLRPIFRINALKLLQNRFKHGLRGVSLTQKKHWQW